MKSFFCRKCRIQHLRLRYCSVFVPFIFLTNSLKEMQYFIARMPLRFSKTVHSVHTELSWTHVDSLQNKPKPKNLLTWNDLGQKIKKKKILWQQVALHTVKACFLSKAIPDHILERKPCLYKVMRPHPFIIWVNTPLRAPCPFCSVPTSSHLEGGEE